MRVVSTPNGWGDYSYWVETDRTVVRRINGLIEDIVRDPEKGIGKPEQLRFSFKGTWSRRINQEHRLVYLVDGDDIVILQARYHYG